MRALATELALLAVIGAVALSAPTSASAATLPTPGALAGEACNLAGQLPGVGGAAKGACEVLTSPLHLAEWLASKGWGALNALLGGVPKQLAGAVQKVVEYGANTVLNGVSGWIASGAVFLVSKVAGVIDRTTTPQVGASWFKGSYATLARIAFTLALPLLFFAAGRALFLRDLGELARSTLVHLPLAALLTGGAVAVTQMALVVTDGLSRQAAGLAGSQPHAFFGQAAKGLVVLGAGGAATGSPALPGFVVAIVAMVAAVLAFALWLELLLRSAAIYVVLVFLPLAFVCLIWPSTARLARRMVELLAALIASKLVIVTIIALAASALLHGGLGGSISAALAGVVLMGLAIWAPWTLMRLIPLMEVAVAHHGPVSAQARGLTVEQMRPADLVKRAFGEASAAEAVAGGEGLRESRGTRQTGANGAGVARRTGTEGGAGLGAAAVAGGALAIGTVAGDAAKRVKAGAAAQAAPTAKVPADEAEASGRDHGPDSAAVAAPATTLAGESPARLDDPQTSLSSEPGAEASAAARHGGRLSSGFTKTTGTGDVASVAEAAARRAPETTGEDRHSAAVRVAAIAGTPAPPSAQAERTPGQPLPEREPSVPAPQAAAGVIAPAVPGAPCDAGNSPGGTREGASCLDAVAEPVDPDELIPDAEADDGR
jgi:hypothetical protein